MHEVGTWVWVRRAAQSGRIIKAESLWGRDVYQVWVPETGAVSSFDAADLTEISEAPSQSGSSISYCAATCRIIDALAQDILLAPMGSSVIPLPHQIRALSRAVSGDRVRFMLADEVGLGKTIEAGLIMRELKLRGLVRRTLVVVPRGLVMQWVAEMQTHFDEAFTVVVPSEFSLQKSGSRASNIWKTADQIICSLDSVKPSEGRRGWTDEETQDHNRQRYEDLILGEWDLIIVDEAHKLGGSTDQVARHKLGRGLSDAAPYLLLLSATPHQGKTDSFHRLVSLLDEETFPAVDSVTRDRVMPFVIRTEKRQAIDQAGRPLFKPRVTKLAAVSWGDQHNEQRLLYQAVTEYVRLGYNQSVREKRNYVGFLMMLMQRMVTSSTRAIRTALERRLGVLQVPDEQIGLYPALSEEEWAELDSQEQAEVLLRKRFKAVKNELAEVNLLLEAARRCESASSDIKAQTLLDWLYRLQQEERDPNLKVLVFTEFVPTQEMLKDFLVARGFSVVCLNGSMDMEVRAQAQKDFAESSRIMISTDAGGEGLNLQFCHVVINYDIPWNPMRLEQRIGRVDRIGQPHVVRAINFVLDGTVEHHVREVLEDKLLVIFRELGIDKASDVLDSAEAGRIFDKLYIEVLLDPDGAAARIERAIAEFRSEAGEVKDRNKLLGTVDNLDPNEVQRILAHPMPHWVEQMTVNYILCHGGQASRANDGWDLDWPDGMHDHRVVFTPKEAQQDPSAEYMTLEDHRIRGLLKTLSIFGDGQVAPVVSVEGLAPDIAGLWSLWEIRLHSESQSRQSIMPLFLHDNGRSLVPSARHIWDRLVAGAFEVAGHIRGSDAQHMFTRCRTAAVVEAESIYRDLMQRHMKRLESDRDRGEYAFESRRRAIGRIGLAQVRRHRLSRLDEEIKAWQAGLERRQSAYPEILPVIIVRVGPRVS